MNGQFLTFLRRSFSFSRTAESSSSCPDENGCRSRGRHIRSYSMNESCAADMETDNLSSSSAPSSTKDELNGSKPKNCSKEDFDLLAVLEQQNRIIESDSKSLNSLTSTHSSQVSLNSGNSPTVDDDQEDVWLIWGQIINDWEFYIKKKNSYVKDLLRKGVPHHFRGIVWQLLCNAQSCPAKDNYSEYIKSTSPCEKVIRRDIARTYPEHEFFREKDGPGQERLFNVMKAYSLYDNEVGYCQGSAFIVGLLLLQMPEEEAFCVLVRLMEDYRLREMYKPYMAELGLYMYQLECIVQELFPEVHIHLQSQNFQTTMFASSWFLTLFTSSLPLQLVCRVMDLLLFEGIEIIFRIAVTILQFCKEDILQLDMEGMLKYFQKEMPAKCETDPDYLINKALQVKYNFKNMKKLEKEYSTLKTREQEELTEMRENAALAGRLIEGQISRAQEAEDNFVIKRELVVMRDRENAIREELKLAYEQIQEMHKLGSQPPSLDMYAEDIIQVLQEELIAVKLREAEKEDVMIHLRQRIHELEEANKQLREVTPDNSMASLQEELIASKLREAEINLSMKELRQKITDLQLMWKKHLAETETDCPSPSKKQEKNMLAQLQKDLMTAKLCEADATAELKELRQKVMELETQNQVSLNQLRRQAEEMKKLQEKFDSALGETNKLQNHLKEEQRKNIDLLSQMKEDQVMCKIRDVEQCQIIAEMRQKISSLEIRNQEIVTAGQLSSGEEDDIIKDLRDRLNDLQAEVGRLETQNRKLTSTVALQNLRQNSKMAGGTIRRINSLLEMAISRSNGTENSEPDFPTSKDLFENGKT
ncbi:ecotropic viral integration site 5 ortholog-like isoform X2 [Tachypleus tridentatus]|uniref:ecotropic viral integration site 5 ortholog-like isoform X2 n=1 Tax=Tachypleus tridentatus TaxID=6853 RepID=UPI003FD235FC